MSRCLFIILAFLTSAMLYAAEIKEFNHPTIYSFEESVYPAEGDKNSVLSLSGEHYKHSGHSLKWQWKAPSAQWSIRKPVDYRERNDIANDNSVSTFVFWVYSGAALPGKSMKVEFLKKGKVCCSFDYGLNFTGWRGAWLAFDRDMQGKPEAGMDEMRMTAPQVAQGELLFDHLILSSFQDVRQHTADFQAPYINTETQNHWLILQPSWHNTFDIQPADYLSDAEQRSIREIENRLEQLLLEEKRPLDIKKLSKSFGVYNIHTNADGTLQGLPIFYERYGETYQHLGGDDYTIIYNNPMGVSKANKLLFDLSVAYTKSYNEEDKSKLAGMYVLLMRHLLDQGFQAGSAMGTLHHLGYSMRNFHASAFIMRSVLQDAGIKHEVQQAMEWFSGAGEVKLKPAIPGMDVDAFNTSLLPRLSAILMLENTPEKASYLYSFSRWIDNGLLYSDGTAGSFKIDGSIYHHRHNYPAYAVGGLEGAVNAVWLLDKTTFGLKQQGHENLKNALLTMRTYCNLLTWPLSLSGRHPDGLGHLSPKHFGLLALCGSPDGNEVIDTELASAYLRLVQNRPTKFARIFRQQGLQPETSPNGNWSYPYSCLSIHRRDDWSVSVMGHSRYLWDTESYVGANHYGRYLNHGNLQILSGGHPISNFESGYNQEGWDWNHFPGTTAAMLTMKELRADIKNLDEDSGYEEMLLSDETFAGGITMQNKNGAFGMKLHEHDKYNGSLRARKSWFLFDNRIIALGSDIVSALPGAPVHTTLFQQYLSQEGDLIEINGEKINEFPFEKELEGKTVHLSDGGNNHFFIRNGKTVVKKSLQHSFHEETDEPTQNNFALAYINHGNAPAKAEYEYMILVQPGQEELNTVNNQMRSKKEQSYMVLQKDRNAHIVYDKASSTTGYVLFEKGKVSAKTPVVSTDTPCLLMTNQPGDNEMAISVCDPDLRFYEGEADEIYNENGKRLERSVYSRNWIENPSGMSEIEIVLKGNWTLKDNSDYITIKQSGKKQTILSVKCQHGLSREATLVRH